MSGLIDARPLSTEESLRRLASVRFGRIIYTRHALITVRLVNHLLEGTRILVHAHTTALTITDHPQAVAYEVDTIDHHTHTGWCVTVRGLAEEITDPALRDLYQHFLDEITDTGHLKRFIRIRPDLITGSEYGPTSASANNKPSPGSEDEQPGAT